MAYGVWKTVPGGDKDDGEALHGTFIVDRDGLVRWAYVGDRPFTDIEALLTELDSIETQTGVSGIRGTLQDTTVVIRIDQPRWPRGKWFQS